ncbi:MAG: hypothetical protein JWN70_2695 [Planctomycetaceae bacterium]|nr:hypothetical protein [Planctomycetaceae bacterium]
MRLDRARFVIRPRGILESLDLAFLFCGRHWWGLLVAAACGIGPAMVVNRFLSTDEESRVFVLFVLMIMEAPWVMAGITLYLGQIAFTDRFSWRLAWRMFWRSWLQLFVFQTIIRGLCVTICVTAPVGYVALYYMNQIILLEQTPVGRTWGRRTALNTRNLGQIIQMICIELLVFSLGVFVASGILRTLSALWRDRFSWTEQLLMMVDSHESWMLALEGWETQLACWLSLAFITVWRYTTYLDCRVRREGWDVELRMRSQALVYQSWEVG